MLMRKATVEAVQQARLDGLTNQQKDRDLCWISWGQPCPGGYHVPPPILRWKWGMGFEGSDAFWRIFLSQFFAEKTRCGSDPPP